MPHSAHSDLVDASVDHRNGDGGHGKLDLEETPTLVSLCQDLGCDALTLRSGATVARQADKKPEESSLTQRVMVGLNISLKCVKKP